MTTLSEFVQNLNDPKNDIKNNLEKSSSVANFFKSLMSFSGSLDDLGMSAPLSLLDHISGLTLHTKKSNFKKFLEINKEDGIFCEDAALDRMNTLKKPLNPIIGEVLKCDITSNGTETGSNEQENWEKTDNVIFCAEQISHHPPITFPSTKIKGKIFNESNGETLLEIHGDWKSDVFVKATQKLFKEIKILDKSDSLFTTENSCYKPVYSKDLPYNHTLNVWKDVIKFLDLNDYSKAAKFKRELEDYQRKYLKTLKSKQIEHQPRYFRKVPIDKNIDGKSQNDYKNYIWEFIE
ncbi:hypothetical protein HK099_006351 [Clydaea vesicula]|uniref:Uncharacterized protein n=1 Tax=Clydaea vesicula TaxID=447962 RepID=A0AAD5UA15_9FUNG|nr:hypothetical protein HK099_006351 [Clydaea vesicula]